MHPIEIVTNVKVTRRSRDGRGQRHPLLIKGSCPSAHTGAEGIRTPIFLCALIDAVLQSLSQKSKIFASSLYTREPLGAPAPVHLSVFLRRTEKLYHIPLVRNDDVILFRPKNREKPEPLGGSGLFWIGAFRLSTYRPDQQRRQRPRRRRDRACPQPGSRWSARSRRWTRRSPERNG